MLSLYPELQAFAEGSMRASQDLHFLRILVLFFRLGSSKFQVSWVPVAVSEATRNLEPLTQYYMQGAAELLQILVRRL